jgi:sugar lactone lactonase YvrE
MEKHMFSGVAIRNSRAKTWFWLVFVATLGVAMLGSGSTSAQTVFTTLSIPIGVEADTGGNIYLDSDAVTTTVVSKWAANGTNLAATTLGGLQVGNLGHMIRVPNTNTLLLLTSNGQIYSFNTNLRLSLFIDLTRISFGTANNVWDVVTGTRRSLTVGIPHWGDISVLVVSPTSWFIYISANTGAAGAFPFVLRLAINLQTNTFTPQVIAMATGTLAGTVSQPGGIAVNGAGTVLVTMPFPSGTGFSSTLVAFTSAFPEVVTNATVPRYVLRTNTTKSGLFDLSSNGMAADAAGNFYIASGVVGSSLCGFSANGALIVLGPNPIAGVTGRCFAVSGLAADSKDVAVSPVGTIPYMTMADGRVLRFPKLVP